MPRKNGPKLWSPIFPVRHKEMIRLKSVLSPLANVRFLWSTHNYIALQRNSTKPENQKIGNAIGIVFPNQNDFVPHINISGARVVKTSPNKENAIRFLEYLTEEPAQRLLAEGNNYTPLLKEYHYPHPLLP